MKVINYTSFMTKTFHPLLIPVNVTSLNALSSLSPEQSVRDMYGRSFDFSEPTKVEWCVALPTATPHVRFAWTLTGDNGVERNSMSEAKRRFDTSLVKKLVATVFSSKSAASEWVEFVSEAVPDPKLLRLPIAFYGGGKCTSFVAEPKSKDEKDEIAYLRQEVEGLKQKVAFLTGLVNLRAEPLRDPLAAAKSRGAAYKKNELANPDNLNLVSASKYAGRSDRVINLERKRGWLYALVPEGNTRGYRYPKWQFDVPASRLRAILDILTPSSLSCWSLHNFLTRPHSDLDGKSPSVALADNTFAIERILDVARRRIDLQQGAS